MGASRPLEVSAALPAIPLIDLKLQQDRIRDAIEAAVRRVLDHGVYIMGPEVQALEQELAAFSGVRHAVSCASGTDALLISLMALGVGRGDAVICPAFTYTATPEAIALLGAEPVFADVRDDTFNLEPGAVAPAAETARERGLRPRAVLAVDLFGQPADYDGIERQAAAEDLVVLCDSAQSFGAEWRGRRVGQMGLLTTTSFFPAKPLGGFGDGGAILTDDDGLAEVMRSIRLHGRGKEKYDVERIGVNSRLDTIQAAILLEKLKIFPDEIERRQQVAERYEADLKECVVTPFVPQGVRSVWAQYTLKIAGGRRDEVAEFLQGRGIATAVYYPRGVHQQMAFRDYKTSKGGAPVAERLAGEVLSIPMHPYLEEAQQDRIVDAVRRAVAFGAGAA